MLYIFNGKVYVKPFENKIVEVSITKKGEDYDVKATKPPLELNGEQLKELISITIEDAYKFQSKEEKKKLLDK